MLSRSTEQIGKRDKKVYFQEKITMVDESNSDQEIGWQDVDNAAWWCKRDDNPGNEVMQAEQLVGVQVISLEGLKRDVDLKWRVNMDNDHFDVISVQQISRGYIRVLVRRGQQYVEQQT